MDQDVDGSPAMGLLAPGAQAAPMPSDPESIDLAPSDPESNDARRCTITPEQAWAVVAVVWTLYVLVLVLGVGEPTHLLLKSLLMPSLLLWVVVALGSDAPALLTGGLALATVGDIGVNFEPPAFLVGMAGFLGMQASYSSGFLRMGAWPVLRDRWPIPAGLAAFWVMANLVLGPRLGELRIPVLVYSAALCTTAGLASGVSRRVAGGGLLFLVSDLLLGAGIAGLGLRGNRVVVDTTYLASQYLIATGWARRVRPGLALPT
jgi:uncharacterized membrane protein YhhN